MLLLAADAGHPAGRVGQQVLDDHVLAYLGAGFAGRVHQDLVEYGPARAVDAAPDRSLQSDRARVEEQPPGRRGTGGHQPVEQAPLRQQGDAGKLYLVGGEGVAGEPGPVDHEYPQALAGEQQGSRGAGYPGPDDDRVVHRYLLVTGEGARRPRDTPLDRPGTRLPAYTMTG